MDVRARLAGFGDKIALIEGDGSSHSYRALLGRADEIAARIGGTGRSLILLEADNSVESVAAYLLGLMGEHVVQLCPPGRAETLDGFVEAFHPDVIIRTTGAADGLAIEHRPDATGRKSGLHPDLAALLSTSGSTGSVKCVRLSQQNLVANALSIAEYLHIGPDERGLLNLPLFYSYGLSVLNSHLLSGATVLLTDLSMIDPALWRFAAAHGATSFPGVPHSYELLDRVGLAEHAPASLRYFTQAGGRLPPEAVERYATLAAERGWRFYVMYGQTEATARMAYLPPERTLDSPEAIGQPIPGGTFLLRRDDGSLIEGGEEAGELVYAGPNVMMGYATTRDALADPAGPAELPTGDLAIRRDDGFYQITGRLSRFIKIFGNRVALDEVERFLEAEGMPGVATGADGMLLVATLDARHQQAIRERLKDKLHIPLENVRTVAVESYPRLPSGKMDYVALRALVAPADAGAAPKPIGSRPQLVSQAFEDVFGDAARDDQASFLSLGGDSLNFLHVALALEAALGTLPEGWEAMTVGELRALARDGDGSPLPIPAGNSLRRASNLDTVRGLACLLVVAYHVVGSDTGLRLPPTSGWRIVMDSLDFVRMPLFYAMAGYFYAMLPVYRDTLGRFLTRKVNALIVPAIVVGLITWSLHRLKYGPDMSLADMLLYGYMHLWFLYALMWVFLAVALLEHRGRASNRLWMAAAILSFLFALKGPRLQYLNFDDAFMLFPYFAFGVLLNRLPGIYQSRAVAALCGVLAISFFLIELLFRSGQIPAPANEVLIGLLAGLPAIIFAFAFMPRIPWLAAAGAYSFTIYLWHPTANAAVRSAINAAGFHPPVWLAFLLGMTAGVAIPIAMHHALKFAQRYQPWLRGPSMALTGA